MEWLDWQSQTAHIDSKFFFEILILLFSAGIIGLERQISKKPAGIRTSILIALGSFLFVKYSVLVAHDVRAVNADPARVLGQVVTGIGFLGAGTIMNKEGLVSGLTTASTIWVQAAIGAIVAFGYYIDAIIFSVLVLFILQGMSKIEIWLHLSHKVKGKGRVRAGVGSSNKNKNQDQEYYYEEDF
ncbi:MAG: MgtC/SapB family protein [Candidatus Caenarcaniphilales bacterium]|jgi:putative Mg2+ transporter-C (MgtC) family protein|nr:MgtC/SapB family protein [Candidatus Caenarcaniphilales bacterium]